MERQEINKKRKVGVVLRNAMDKTAVVEVTRTVKDPLYKKYIRRKKKFMIHDEKNECKLGDMVELEECRPLSKRKSWRLIKILKHEELPEVVKANNVEDKAEEIQEEMAKEELKHEF